MSRFALRTLISRRCKEDGALKVAQRLKHPLIGYRALRTDFASLDACELFTLYARPRMNVTSLTRANIITLGRFGSIALSTVGSPPSESIARVTTFVAWRYLTTIGMYLPMTSPGLYGWSRCYLHYMFGGCFGHGSMSPPSI